MQSALFFIGLVTTGPALLVIVFLIVQLRRWLSGFEPNYGGPLAYQVGDMVQCSFGRYHRTGTITRIVPSGDTQLSWLITIRFEWIDATGQLCCCEVLRPYWQICGKVTSQRGWNTLWKKEHESVRDQEFEEHGWVK